MSTHYIKSNLPRYLEIAGVALEPLGTKVNDEELKLLKKHPHFKQMIERGDLQLVSKDELRTGEGESPEDPKSDGASGIDLETATAAEIIEWVKTSADVGALNSLTEDERKTVKDAAKKRLAELEEAAGE